MSAHILRDFWFAPRVVIEAHGTAYAQDWIEAAVKLRPNVTHPFPFADRFFNSFNFGLCKAAPVTGLMSNRQRSTRLVMENRPRGHQWVDNFPLGFGGSSCLFTAV